MKQLLLFLLCLISLTSFAQQEAQDSMVRSTAWKGYKNVFAATDAEVTEARIRIKDHRTNTGLTGKNLGYVEGSINGNKVDNKLWTSGEARPETEPQIFEATVEKGGGGKSWLRNVDTEYKMLNKIASEQGGVAGTVYPEVTGELKIVSERPYCNSCRSVIKQFHQMFPNIKLILVDGAQ